MEGGVSPILTRKGWKAKVDPLIVWEAEFIAEPAQASVGQSKDAAGGGRSG